MLYWCMVVISLHIDLTINSIITIAKSCTHIFKSRFKIITLRKEV